MVKIQIMYIKIYTDYSYLQSVLNTNQLNMPLASLYRSISSLGAWWAEEH